MKTLRMILFSALAATSCYGNTAGSQPDASGVSPVAASSAVETTEVIKIRLDECATHHDLELCWRKISDSRCPAGAKCFWAGEVKVLLDANHPGAATKGPAGIQLGIGAHGESVTAAVFGYQLQLLEVDPYPQEGVTQKRDDYVAEIRISRAAQTP